MATPARFRVARPTVDIERAIAFWTGTVGLELLSQFDDHAGYDGVILGYPDASWELEFTRHSSGSPIPTPTHEDITVLYVAESVAAEIVSRLQVAGHRPFTHPNPYWTAMGASAHADPDGYTLIVFPLDH